MSKTSTVVLFSVNWSDFLSRDVIMNRLLAACKKAVKTVIEEKAKNLLEELGLPEVKIQSFVTWKSCSSSLRSTFSSFHIEH
jgi:hypothetical protein